MEEPPQRVAARAHPLLAVRHRLHPADDHPDVLPGRPAVRRSTRSTSRSPTRRPATGSSPPTTTTSTTPRVVHRLPVGHRADRRRTAPRSRRTSRPVSTAADRDPGPDRRPVLRLRAAVRRGDSELVAAGHAAARSGCTARCIDGAGDPVPDALLEIWQADADGAVPPAAGLAAPRRLDLHRLGPRRHRRRRPLLASPRVEPGATGRTGPVLRGDGVRPRACSTGCSPGPTCPARAAGRRPAAGRRCPPSGATR